MNIGFVSTWLERGAAYVTKQYIELLKDKHNVFVYARGGEYYAKGDPKWDLPYVTWGLKLRGQYINYKHLKKWIKKNNINTIFFNEQQRADIIYKIKKNMPHIKVGAYIDYYKENTVSDFYLYDFLICNTKRHYSVFKKHPQSYYVPWGTNIELFKPKDSTNEELTFFHSSGMSTRKGTKYLINAFINGEIYRNAKLIIHSQKNFERTFGYDKAKLEKYNIKVIERTVSAPGLYCLGDVYVYPTLLDGLGLTMYEALASGLPVITTNNAPMNEVINSKVGYLVDVKEFRSRSDGYYWPLSIPEEESLINGMKYYIEREDKIKKYKKIAREEAVEKWNWKDRKETVINIFENTEVIVKNPKYEKIDNLEWIEKLIRGVSSSYLLHFINVVLKRKN